MAGWFINEDGQPYWYTGTEEEQAEEFPGDYHGALPSEEVANATADWLDKMPAGVHVRELVYLPPDDDGPGARFRVISDKHSNHNLPIGAVVRWYDFVDGVNLYTMGLDDDEVAIDDRDLEEVE